MGLFRRANKFPVDGRTILITGGSQGTGKSAARLLASKGANIMIVARDLQKLQDAVSYIKAGALRPDTQRFSYISADLMIPSEATRVLHETTTWNNSTPPGIVWCCAGSSHPTLFVDTPIEKLSEQMNSNYFSTAYIAHASLKYWLKPSQSPKAPIPSPAPSNTPPQPRHLIFTSSVAAFYPIIGYAPYSPSKAALRTLSDNLSQELLLYPPTPTSPRITIHTIFPGGILTPAYEAENLIKPYITKMLEADDEPQTADAVAAASIRGLENGDEMITTKWLGWAMMCSALGASKRSGWGIMDTIGGWVIGGVMGWIRWDMDGKVKAFGRENGASGNKMK